jgi:hypothetical protein
VTKCQFLEIAENKCVNRSLKYFQPRPLNKSIWQYEGRNKCDKGEMLVNAETIQSESKFGTVSKKVFSISNFNITRNIESMKSAPNEIQLTSKWLGIMLNI